MPGEERTHKQLVLCHLQLKAQGKWRKKYIYIIFYMHIQIHCYRLIAFYIHIICLLYAFPPWIMKCFILFCFLRIEIVYYIFLTPLSNIMHSA